MPNRIRLSYANVTATLALVVALSGSAVAAGVPVGSVGTPQLKNRAVTGAKIAAGAVGPSQLSPAARALARSGPATPIPVMGSVNELPAPGNLAGATVRQSLFGSGPGNGSGLGVGSFTSAVPTRVRRFRVAILSDLVPDGRVTVSLRSRASLSDQEETLASCTITGTSGAADTRCSSSETPTIPASTFVYLVIGLLGPPNPSTTDPEVAYWSFELVPAS